MLIKLVVLSGQLSYLRDELQWLLELGLSL